MLGYGASDDCCHDYIDDDVLEEKDADNDETFGADVVPDTEWEIEDLAQQTETIGSTYKRNRTEISACDTPITAKCNNLEAQGGYTNYQAFAMESIEKSLYDLVKDDDEPGVSSPIVKAKNNFYGSSTMSNNSSVGSFFDLYPENQTKSAKNIWGHHYHASNATPTKKTIDLANLPPLVPEKTAFFQPPQLPTIAVADDESKNSLNFLLSKLSATNSNNIVPTVNETKKVKTVQEIEAELLAMTKKTSNSLNDAPSSSVVDSVKSESSNNSQDIKILGLPLLQPLPSMNSILTPEVVAACAVNPVLLNAVYSQLLAAMAASSQEQQLLDVTAAAVGSPPPPFPPQLLNPQMRAMLLAVLASGKPLPPSLLQSLPVAPTGQSKLNFPAPPGFPHLSNTPVIDPCLLLAAKNGLIRPPESQVTSPLIKVKPIVPLQGSSIGGPTFRNRRENESDIDEFAGLMTKRERGYMVNIQCIQVRTDDSYNDDYYWVMYKKRRIESGNGTKDSVKGVLSDLRDIHKDFEHRAYVPPDFQGSLGKLQSSSIACPRHLIDLRQNAAENSNAESKESPSSSPASAETTADQAKLVSLSKVNTNLLLDIENAYVEALKCDQYLVELQGYNQCELSDRISYSTHLFDSPQTKSFHTFLDFVQLFSLMCGENLSKIVWCTKNVASLIASDSNKLQCVLSSRKGRRLVAKILPFLQNIEMALILNLFFESLFKKTNGLSDEVYSFFVKSLNETLDNSSELNWTELLEKFLSNYSLVNRSSVHLRADCLLFVLLFHCSLQNAKLSDSVQDQLVDHLRSFSSKIQLKDKQLFVVYVRKFIVDLDVKLNSLGAYFRSGKSETLGSSGDFLANIFV